MASAANMVVEVDLNDAGRCLGDYGGRLAAAGQGETDQLSGLAQQHGKEAAAIAKQGVGALALRMGTPTLVAAVAVWMAWFFMPAFSVEFFLVSRLFTFWQILGINEATLSNPAASDHGIFALIGLLAIAAPFAVPFVRHPRVKLLNAAPLAYLVIAILGLIWRANSAAGSAGGNSEMARGIAREVASPRGTRSRLGSGRMY